ncbi:MAG TPA: PAS domain S-box protein [Smithella sp.]|nr:PAS domain S-box protein [Smithella sp.]
MALRKSKIKNKRGEEHKFRTLAEQSSDIILLVNREGNIIYENPAAAEIMGFNVEERIGSKVFENIHPDDLNIVINAFNTLFGSENAPVQRGEARARKKDGSWRTFEVVASPLKEGDVFDAVIINLHDITERKRTEMILREQEERLLGITENLPGTVFQFYAKDNGECGVTYIRKRMTQYFDENPDLTDFFSFFVSRIHEEDRDRFLSSIQDAVEKEIPWNFEGRFFATKTGEMVWFQGLSTPIRREDQLIFNGILLNITERKQAEERYRHIFENAQEGIYQSTPEGRFILANQSMARILGYDSPQNLITAVTDIASQVYADAEVRAEFIRIMEKQGFVRSSEVRFRRKDDSIIWVSGTMQAVRDDKGRILYEGVIEDVTQRKESVERLRHALTGTVRAIAAIVETRDPYTAGHQRQAGDLALSIAAEMGLSNDRMEGLRLAAIIHDLGKISVPSEILSKPSELTALEFSLIKTHAQAGHDILKDIEFPWPVARIVFEHHERMDGSGYPRMLKGENIILEARILAVADVVEAMSSHRPYRASLGIEAALEEIEQNRGTFYDADVVDACLRLFREKGYGLTCEIEINRA